MPETRSLATTRKLALTGMFAGVAWGAGYVESIPNAELLSVILFVGGFVLGPAYGAIAGAVGMALFSVINPYGSGLLHPVVFSSQVLGMAIVGAWGGLLGLAGLGATRTRAVLVVSSGILLTLLYDLITNVATAFVFGQWKAILLGAVPFTLIHVGTNAALFATVGLVLVKALEPVRRSLLPPRALVFAMVLALIAVAGPARAQGTTPIPAPPADTTHATADSSTAMHDSLKADVRSVPENRDAAEDSVAYRDRSRSLPPPSWGDGPATLLRRDDLDLATALTREGGFVERFDDPNASAEPLGRFGIAGPGVLVTWLGMPLTGPGAVGGETARVPWNAVQSVVAPSLPVSATRPYRGALGEVEVRPWLPVTKHPRVQAWAAAGGPELSGAGFTVSASARNVSGFLAVDDDENGPLELTGPAAHHGLAFALTGRFGPWIADGAYRSNRSAIEDATPRHERRRGEAGRLGLERGWGARRVRLAFERTADSFSDESDLVGDLEQRGRGGRGELSFDDSLAGGHARAALTYGHETLESEGNIVFERRAKDLGWGAVSFDRSVGASGRIDLAVGGGKWGDGPTDVAPSVRYEHVVSARTMLWAGGGRGLASTISPVADADLDSTAGDPLAQRTSVWLAGAGIEWRSPREALGGTWRGAWPKHEFRLRAALYGGRADPGTDPARFLLGGQAVGARAGEAVGDATTFGALVATGAYAVLEGLTVEGGGHVLGRTVDAALTPSDPEGRAWFGVEGRKRTLHGDADLRLGATFEWIGPRTGTPAGDLPSATRFGLHAGFVLDEFEARLVWRNLAGSNRFLPYTSPADGELVDFDVDVLRIEARWTFWD